MTEEQIEKIKTAASRVIDLAVQQDKVYTDLVAELGFKSYETRWASGADPEEIKAANPTGWLFDCVYNSRNLDEDIQRMIEAKHRYDEYFKNKPE